MTDVITFEDGRQIVLVADKGTIRLSLWANRGSTGIVIDRKTAIRLRTGLLAAILEVEKG